MTQPGPRQAVTSVPYKLVNILFAILFFAAAVLSVLYGSGGTSGTPWYTLLFAALGGVAATGALYRLYTLIRGISPGAERLLVALLLLLLVALQVLAAWQLAGALPQQTQAGGVYLHALEYVQNGTLPGDYFTVYPTKAGAYVLLCGVLSLGKMLGIGQGILPMVLNAVAIDAAVVLLYFCARRLFGVQKAIFALFLSAIAAPFLLYVPLVCAETLALPFPVAIVLLWLRVRAAWRTEKNTKALKTFLLLSLVAALGALLKPIVLVLWLATALDILLLLRGKGKMPILLLGLLVLAVPLGAGFFFMFSLPMLAGTVPWSFPQTAFIMMGLSGNGGYNEADAALVLAKTGGNARSQFVQEEILRRAAGMNPIQFIKHYCAKLANTYGDGMYMAQAHLQSAAGSGSGGLWAWVLPGGRFYMPASVVAFALQMAVLVYAAWGAVVSMLRKNNALGFVRLGLLGMFLFLLVFSSTPTDVLCFLPLGMLCALEAAPMPLSDAEKLKARHKMEQELFGYLPDDQDYYEEELDDEWETEEGEWGPEEDEEWPEENSAPRQQPLGGTPQWLAPQERTAPPMLEQETPYALPALQHLMAEEDAQLLHQLKVEKIPEEVLAEERGSCPAEETGVESPPQPEPVHRAEETGAPTLEELFFQHEKAGEEQPPLPQHWPAEAQLLTPPATQSMDEPSWMGEEETAEHFLWEEKTAGDEKQPLWHQEPKEPLADAGAPPQQAVVWQLDELQATPGEAMPPHQVLSGEETHRDSISPAPQPPQSQNWMLPEEETQAVIDLLLPSEAKQPVVDPLLPEEVYPLTDAVPQAEEQAVPEAPEQPAIDTPLSEQPAADPLPPEEVYPPAGAVLQTEEPELPAQPAADLQLYEGAEQPADDPLPTEEMYPPADAAPQPEELEQPTIDPLPPERPETQTAGQLLAEEIYPPAGAVPQPEESQPLEADWPPEEDLPSAPPAGPYQLPQQPGAWQATLNPNLLDQQQNWMLELDETPAPAPVAEGYVDAPQPQPEETLSETPAQDILPPAEEPRAETQGVEEQPGMEMPEPEAEPETPPRPPLPTPLEIQPAAPGGDAAWQVMQSIERQLAGGEARPDRAFEPPAAPTTAAGPLPGTAAAAPPAVLPNMALDITTPTIHHGNIDDTIPPLYEEEQEVGGVNIWLAEQGMEWVPPEGVKMWPSVPGKWELAPHETPDNE